MDAEYKLADAFMDASMCICRRVVHVYRGVRKRMHVQYAQQCASSNGSVCVHGNILVRTSLLCCCAYNRFLSRRTVRGKGRAAGCHASTLNLKWACAAVETRRLPTVSIKQQLQRPTNDRVLIADLHAELQSLCCHFWETGRIISSHV